MLGRWRRRKEGYRGRGRGEWSRILECRIGEHEGVAVMVADGGGCCLELKRKEGKVSDGLYI